MIHIYQKHISPYLHILTKTLFGSSQGCRFYPTCSEYSKLAFKKYSLSKALYLSTVRLLRCNPLFKGGVDPLP